MGCTLRRLVAKNAVSKVVNDATNLLAPRQLGYGISGGVEAAVHATRRYLNQLQTDKALIKLDFRNAFNSVRRDKMLEAVQDLIPSIYPFVHSPYHPHSFGTKGHSAHQRVCSKWTIWAPSFSACPFTVTAPSYQPSFAWNIWTTLPWVALSRRFYMIWKL